MCLLSKREITIFAQNEAYRRFGGTLEWDPFSASRQGDLVQIPGSEQAYELVHHFVTQVNTLFKFWSDPLLLNFFSAISYRLVAYLGNPPPNRPSVSYPYALVTS